MQNRHTVAGAAARTMAQCTIHPIDTVKTRLQVLLMPRTSDCLLSGRMDKHI
jgi:hypothetical protein